MSGHKRPTKIPLTMTSPEVQWNTGETDKAHGFRGNIGLRWVQGVVKFRKVEIKATLACIPRGETGRNP